MTDTEKRSWPLHQTLWLGAMLSILGLGLLNLGQVQGELSLPLLGAQLGLFVAAFTLMLLGAIAKARRASVATAPAISRQATVPFGLAIAGVALVALVVVFVAVAPGAEDASIGSTGVPIWVWPVTAAIVSALLLIAAIVLAARALIPSTRNPRAIAALAAGLFTWPIALVVLFSTGLVGIGSTPVAPLLGVPLGELRSADGSMQTFELEAGVEGVGVQFLCTGDGIFSVDVGSGSATGLDCADAPTGVWLPVGNDQPAVLTVSFDEASEDAEWTVRLADASEFLNGSSWEF